MTKPTCAEAFHPFDFIDEECEGRGWTIERLAAEMPGDDLFNLTLLRLYELRDPSHIPCSLLFDKLGVAFGTSWEIWRNLDRGWREHPTIKGGA